jgi:hypothetical protein
MMSLKTKHTVILTLAMLAMLTFSVGAFVAAGMRWSG